MRTITIFRGLAGIGKSYHANRLFHNGRINPDSIRELFGNDVITDNGRKIDFTKEAKVWAFIYNLIDEKMSNGDTIAIEGTFKKQSSVNKIIALANKHRYRIILVDFELLYGDEHLPLALVRNAEREAAYRLSDEAIYDMYEHYTKKIILPSNSYIVKSIATMESEIAAFTTFSLDIDANKYNDVIFVGDIHGKSLDIIDNLREDNLYVFLGDFFDRFNNEKNLLKLFEFFSSDHDNVVLIEGNHETHIRNYLLNKEVSSQSFNDTMNILSTYYNHDKLNSKLSNIVNKLKPYIIINRDEKNIICSHAGLHSAKEISSSLDTWRYSELLFVKGIFGYKKFDDQFIPKEESFLSMQIHGHRCSNSDSTEYSINLNQTTNEVLAYSLNSMSLV